VAERVKRCFNSAPGSCVLRQAGQPVSMAVLKAVVKELRRLNDQPAPEGHTGQRVNVLDFTGVDMPRLPRDAATSGNAEESTDALADPNDTLHPLTLAAEQIVCPGDAATRAHRVSRLHLDNSELYDADAEALAALIRSPACTLTQLTLRANRISPNGADALKKALKHNTRLRILDLSDNEWMKAEGFSPSGDEILRTIAERLYNNANGVSNLSAAQRLFG
jgi:hypothetical protein